MAAYHQVYDSHHLQADFQEPGSAPEPYTRYRVWATFYLITIALIQKEQQPFPYKSGGEQANGRYSMVWITALSFL